MESLLSLVETYGLPTVTIAAVILAAVRIIDHILKKQERESETEQKEIESRLDDTETLRSITREDRAWLVKEKERNELLVQKTMDMLREFSDCKGEVAQLKQEVDDEKTERLQEKTFWEQLRHQDLLERETEKLQMLGAIDELKRAYDELKRNYVELETQLKVKDQIIEQLKLK